MDHMRTSIDEIERNIEEMKHLRESSKRKREELETIVKEIEEQNKEITAVTTAVEQQQGLNNGASNPKKKKVSIIQPFCNPYTFHCINSFYISLY